MIKLKTKNLIRYVIGYVLAFALMTAAPACQAPAKQSIVMRTEILAAMGGDQSKSVAGFRQIDTAIIGRLCRAIAKRRGGLILYYGIGEPTDKSGLRCHVKSIPDLDTNLPITKQAEQKQLIDELKAYNERQINEFLKVIEEQVLGPPAEGNAIMHTDINGFFSKVNILLSEPENQGMEKYVFVYSDGIQSVDGHDQPATFDFTTTDFTLCLAGWKTEMPSKGIEIKRFESLPGFAQYMETVTSLKN